MKQTLLFAALGLTALGAGAQEVGNVLSSTPVIQQVAVPRTYCNQPQAVMVQPQTSGGGGLVGALTGAAIGSTIGGGSGTAAAMLIGTIGGAIVGNNIEANNSRHYAYAQPACGSETTYENRTVGYNVTYEYAGRQYQVQMPYDPGPTIRLQVSPMAAGAQDMPPVQASGPVIAPPIQQAQVIVPAPAPIVYQPYATYPAYPAYAPPVYYRPYYPPIGVSLNFGFGGHRHHHRHHGHRHRR
jgi:uncharacterized protein YcfJ